MQSNDSPELSSAFSAYNYQNTSPAENRSNNSSGRKQLPPKMKKLPGKIASSTPISNEKGIHHKRKNSSFDSDSDDETKSTNHHASLSRTKKVKSPDKAKRSLKTNRNSNFNPNEFGKKSNIKTKGRNGGTEPIPTNSKESTRLTDGDDTSSDFVANRKHFPFTPKSSYSAALNLTPYTGSVEEGEKLFGVLIKPIQVSTFMAKYWEQKPYRVTRLCPNYYKDLLSTEEIDKMLRDNHLEFTKNIDITQYKNGVRETLNPIGRAMPPCVWQHYADGCSIRILNPQTFLPSIHAMNATLQEYFQCMTGANVYLTPPNSQGFAPHYDDIEAFVLQIEGRKHWRLYEPITRNEKWPRVSSKNFDQDEIGEPVLDVVLEAGDLLYFPRGYIHQADTVKDSHSLHITVSVYQKQTYGDLLEILIPMALKEAINENSNLRKGLPLKIWQCMGLVNSDDFYPERDAMITQIKQCFETVCRSVKSDANLDNAVDHMALKYQHDALPPLLTAEEKLRTVYSAKATISEDGEIEYPCIDIHTKIRLIRQNILRMVRHGSEIRVYYSSENSKEYHGFETNFLEIDPSDAPAVEVLTKAYPTFITPDHLQLEEEERNVSVAQDLWEKGILMTEEPLV